MNSAKVTPLFCPLWAYGRLRDKGSDTICISDLDKQRSNFHAKTLWVPDACWSTSLEDCLGVERMNMILRTQRNIRQHSLLLGDFTSSLKTRL
jgi:hypothetical protein